MIRIVLFAVLVQWNLANHYVAPPVLFWGSRINQPKAPTVFKAITRLEFSELMEQLLRDHMIVSYFAKNLTAKDFNCVLPQNNEICYRYLSQVTYRTFYSKVDKPFEALEKIATPELFVHNVDLSADLQVQLNTVPNCQIGHIYAFNFSDNFVKRYQNHWSHDRFISGMSQELRLSNCSFVELYSALNSFPAKNLQRKLFKIMTSRQASYSRKILDKPKKENVTKKIILRTPVAALAFENIVYLQEIRQDSNVYYKRTIIVLLEKHMNIKLLDDKTLKGGFQIKLPTSAGIMRINILNAHGTWLMSEVKFMGNRSFVFKDMYYFDKKFTFCCPVVTALSKRAERLVFYEFQLDILTYANQSALDEDYEEKPCWMCQQYLSPDLMQAYFVHFIVLSVFAIGIAMIWDIGRQGRLPDPQAQQLIIRTGR